MTFIAAFAPDAIRAGIAQAAKFGSARQYLLRVQEDCEAELAQIAIAAEQGTPFAKQFCPARAHEVYTALALIALGLGLYTENCTCGYPHFAKHAETCPANAFFTVLNPA